LEAVRQFDPDDAYGEGMLGWLAYNDGLYASAIEHYQQADEMEPFKAKLHFQWGLACMKMESWKSASDQFRLAVTIDPQHADASDALSQSLQKQRDFDGAIQSARRAVMLTERKRPEFLLQLAESLAENRQLVEAQQVAVESLNVTRSNDAELILRIRRRLQEYQK
jgi:tetratricopeptide (TPR) repeat protein